MSEKDNKFVLGDNSDGYRRSPEKTQAFVFPERSVKKQPLTAQRAQVRRSAAGEKSAEPVRRRTQAEPVRKKSRQAAKKTAGKPGGASRKRAGVPGNDTALSQNERRKLHNEQRRRQRRRKQIFTYVAVCLAVLVVAAVLSLTVFFQINEFVVEGDSPYTDEQIINACGLTMGENIIRCDADSVSGNLAQALPYIGSAFVERSASGKVTITVETTAPYWSVLDGERSILVDASGKVLEIADAEKALEATIVQGIVVSECVPGQQVVLSEDVPFSFLNTVGQAVISAGITELTSLNLSDVDYMQALYDGRINIVIGTADDLDMKLALAAEVIERENQIDPAQYGTIDLTIDNMAYFRPIEDELPYSSQVPASAENTDNDVTNEAPIA